jgi:DNA polymerase I-like protein with 3'-5' exonuclease and polymerase domains
MNIIEYGNDTTYMIVFSNGVIDSIREQFIECIVIDLQAKTVPNTKRFYAELETEIEEYNPDRILAIGTVASKVLLQERYTDIRKCHGGLFSMTDGSIVVPVYEQYADRDIERAKILQYEVPEYSEVTELPTLEGAIYLDIETDSLEANTITSIQIGDNSNVYYIASPSSKLLSDLYDYLLLRKGDKLIGHNLISFDLPALSKHTGCDWLDIPEIYDTMILAHNRGLKPLGLKHLTTMYTDVNNPDAYAQAAHSFDTVYAVADIVATRALYQRLVRKGIRPIDTLAMQTAIVFQRAHQRGIAVNRDTLLTEQYKLQVETEQLWDRLEEFGFINWQSNKEVSEFLTDMGIPLTELTQGGNYSVASKVLEDHRDWQVVDTLLKYREATKLLSTFYDKYVELTADGTSTIHPSMLVWGTDTGRSSCKDPNLQQVPTEVKGVFVSRYEGGSIAQFDLAQSELRCAVLVSGDTTMSEALQNSDYHRTVASNAFGVPYDEVSKEQRQIAKVISFAGILYGGSAKGIAQSTGASVDVLEKAVLNVKNTFSHLAQWQDEQIARAYRTHKIVAHYGFIRDVSSMVDGTVYWKGRVKRAAMNTPIQGLSAFICYELCCYIDRELENMNSCFIAQVHDSVFIDVYPGEEDRIEDICKEAFQYLNDTHLNKLPGWNLIAVEGKLSYNRTMKDESEEVIKLTSERDKE